MLHVQRFLNEQPLTALTERYAISVKRHSEHPNLVLLKYSQIESPMGDPLVQECRGLVLDEGDHWRVVSAPYWKFFNHGEGHAAPLDWATAVVQEKLDGSLMTLYSYKGQWHVASSGLPDASGKTDGVDTFSALFWKTWEQLGYRLPTDHTCCYMFELMTPSNRIVVQYAEPRLVLHGVRRLETLTELAPSSVAQQYGWECVRTFPFGALEVVIQAAEGLEPMCGEGFVVQDAQFRRLKVKSTQYVALGHMRSRASERGLLDLARKNESAEFLAYFPHLQQSFAALRGGYEAVVAEIEDVYSQIRPAANQKDFALLAMPHRFSGALFQLRSGKCDSARQFLADMPIKKLEDWLGVELADEVLEAA